MPKASANPLRLLLLLLLVAIVAIGSCLAVFYGFIRPSLPVDYQQETFVERLALNPAQQAEVEEIDRNFETRRQEILKKFRAATKDLALLLEQENEYSEEVAGAIERVHAVHGELQALSVRRYFAVLDVLPEQKRPEFRRLAADALSHPE